MRGQRRRSATCEADEEVALEAEHLLLLLGLGVVEAEQVQEAVRREQQQLVHRGVPGGLRLRLGDLRAQHDVAEQPGGRRLVLGAGAQLVHREAQHVGGAGLVHPLHVQLLHRALVDEHDRELGVGVHVQSRRGRTP